MQRKVTIYASLGTALEYFDFIIYGMMASFIGPLFFSGDQWAPLQAFLILAMGYLVRPLGGAFLGAYGDVKGRQKAFCLSILCMAIATLTMALLPTASSWGIFATLALVLCRLVQGFSYGGELPGAITMISESSDEKNRSKKCSFAVSATTLGALSATFFLYLLTKFLSQEQILAWGWRVPFLFGGFSALFIYLGRKKMTLEPTTSTRSLREPVSEIFKNHSVSILCAILAMIFPASLILFNLYFPYYLSTNLSIPTQDVYFALTIGLLFSLFSLPVFGMIADKIGKRFCFAVNAILFATVGVFLLKLLAAKSVILFICLFQAFLSCAMASFMPVLSELFPKRVRYSAVAIAYNAAFVIAALLPPTFTKLQTLFPNLSLFLFLSIIAFLGFCGSVLSFRSQKNWQYAEPSK
jgi:MFS family permease